MADDTTVIEGAVKFRDGKKWKSRWCVMRKLSPVADCLHVQLYRDSKARYKRGPTKASLSLQRFLGAEAGFTLDKEANTLALVCEDVTVLLAFDTRERLLQWQAKVAAQLGESRTFAVLLAGGAGRLSAGPATLHVRAARLALTSGAPPRLRAVWEVAHLRRYGLVDGRFCLEGGSLCGAGEGLHTLLSERAREICESVLMAAAGDPLRRGTNGSESPKLHAGYRSETRLSEPEEYDADLGLGDTESVRAGRAGRAAGMARCRSCMSKLGALSRSSTAGALTPGFCPAWTMEAGERCGCPDRGNDVGPYENYDVPKTPHTEVESEYYDTPKRLKQGLSGNVESFRATRSRDSNTPFAREPCGCGTHSVRGASWTCLPLCRERADSRPPRPPARLPHVTTAAPRPRVSGDGPRAEYENLSFALSLEHYENAKDVLVKAGITPAELGALAACERCGPYLAMAPAERAGYAAMSPAGPARPARWASDPSLTSEEPPGPPPAEPASPAPRPPRSCSVPARANRDSSSSADSGVSGCRARAGRGARGNPTRRGDSRSTSSGTSDMSDYIETLSLCSDHSSSGAPLRYRAEVGAGRSSSLLRPRSGGEYLQVAPLSSLPRPTRGAVSLAQSVTKSSQTPPFRGKTGICNEVLAS